MPLGERVLCVSGRLSFELVQKAAVAGAPILIGVGAPSSLAIELAADRGLTLCGFARGTSVNVYTHAERVQAAAEGNYVVADWVIPTASDLLKQLKQNPSRQTQINQALTRNVHAEAANQARM